MIKVCVRSEIEESKVEYLHETLNFEFRTLILASRPFLMIQVDIPLDDRL